MITLDEIAAQEAVFARAFAAGDPSLRYREARIARQELYYDPSGALEELTAPGP